MRISKKHRKIRKKKTRIRVKNKIKRKHYSRKNTYKLGGTGVLINDGSNTAEQKFLFFVENSTIRFLSRGSFGLTVLATLNPGIISPYTSMDPTTYGNPINRIIIKFIITSVIPTTFKINKDIKLRSTSLNEVIDETNIQTNVALKTMNYLEPICPCPLYFNGKFSHEHLINLIKPRILNDGSTNQNTLKQFIDTIADFIRPDVSNNRYKSITVIGMEFAEGYTPLYSLKRDPNYEQYVLMVAYMLIKLAVETGYAHGDYHNSNVMINTTKTNYFDGKQGAPLLIDYGLATKIQLPLLNTIKEHYNKNKYTKILEILYKQIPRKDGLDLPSYPDHYGYIYNLAVSIPTGNYKIDELFKKRDRSIQNTIRQFEGLHTSDPSKYPLLPLPNSIKNKMYSGVDVHIELVDVPVPVKIVSSLEDPRILFNEMYRKLLDEMYRTLFTYFDDNYTKSQLRCFFIISCYNFAYLLEYLNRNRKTAHPEYKFLMFLFIEDFAVTNNNDNLSFSQFFSLVCNYQNNTTNKDRIIYIINNNLCPLFDGKKVKNTEYAPIFANTYTTKKEFIELMLDPRMYTNPASLLQLVGPKVRPEVETPELPFEGEGNGEEV